jgi:hypothetical protein
VVLAIPLARHLLVVVIKLSVLPAILVVAILPAILCKSGRAGKRKKCGGKYQNSKMHLHRILSFGSTQFPFYIASLRDLRTALCLTQVGIE